MGTIVIYELLTRKSRITTDKCTWKRKSDLKKIAKMTVTENWDDHNCTAELWSAQTSFKKCVHQSSWHSLEIYFF